MSADVVKLIKGLSARPLVRYRPLRLLASVALGLVALVPPVGCTTLCIAAMVDSGDATFGVGMGISVVLLLTGWLGLSRLGAWWDKRFQRQTLERELSMSLRAAGLDADSEHPRAVAIREAFWDRAQRCALYGLRARLAQHQPPQDLLDALWLSAVNNKFVILVLGVIWSLLTLLTMLLMSSENSANIGQLLKCAQASAAFYASGIFYLLCATGLSSFIKERSEHRELIRETHRVANLVETAGGLSLAEHEVRDLLQGALSDAAFVGGEVELVAQEVSFDQEDVSLDLDQQLDQQLDQSIETSLDLDAALQPAHRRRGEEDL